MTVDLAEDQRDDRIRVLRQGPCCPGVATSWLTRRSLSISLFDRLDERFRHELQAVTRRYLREGNQLYPETVSLWNDVA